MHVLLLVAWLAGVCRGFEDPLEGSEGEEGARVYSVDPMSGAFFAEVAGEGEPTPVNLVPQDGTTTQDVLQFTSLAELIQYMGRSCVACQLSLESTDFFIDSPIAKFPRTNFQLDGAGATVHFMGTASAALAAARAACNQDLLLFEKSEQRGGKYRVDVSGTAVIFQPNTENVSIQNLRLKLNRQAGGFSSMTNFTNITIHNVEILDVPMASYAVNFVAFQNVTQTHFVIDNCTVNSRGFGINLAARSGHSSNHTIASNTLVQTVGHAILFSGVGYSLITSNNVSNVNLLPPPADRFGHGIAIDGNAGLDPVNYVVVQGNRVDTVYGYNHLRDKYEGIEIADGIFNVMVQDNYVANVELGYGIYFGGGLSHSVGAVIKGNYISNVYDYGVRIENRNATDPHYTSNVFVYNNTIVGCSPAGIYTGRSSANVKIFQNTLANSGNLTGVADAPTCMNCTKRGNVANGKAPPDIWDAPFMFFSDYSD